MAAPKSGPTAKQRSEDRLGHRTAAELANVTTISPRQEEPPPVVPEPRESWSDTARMMWDAFVSSPVREYFESTDYAACHFLCDLVTDCQATGYRPGQLMDIRMRMVDLMFTESARRAANIQINRTPAVQDPARVAAINQAANRRRPVS